MRLLAFKSLTSKVAENSLFRFCVCLRTLGSMENHVKVGIIGGSGLDDPDIIHNRVEKSVSTPFGQPSDVLIEGTIRNVPCVLLARHGRKHTIMPSHINFRANIWALKAAGCTHVIASTACGSLKEELKPGNLVILNSFIDRTHKRISTFYDSTLNLMDGICHLPMEPAFCEDTRKVVMKSAEKLGLDYHSSGTCITIEGPRFSSKAESKLFISWGCDVINMTTVPEVILAKEAGLCYSAIALITDYDCWRDSGDVVNVSDVLAAFKKNTKKVTDLIIETVVQIAENNWDKTINSLKTTVENSIMKPKHQD